MDRTSRVASSDLVMNQILESVSIIKGSSQLVERRFVSGVVVTPDFLTASMSRIQRESDSIAANLRILSGFFGPSGGFGQ